jgi:hypothetical protein
MIAQVQLRLLLRGIAFASLAAVAALALGAAVGAGRAIAAEPAIVPQEGATYPLGTRVTGPCDPSGDPDGGLQSDIEYQGYWDSKGRLHYKDYRDLHNDWANRGSPSDGWEIRAVRLRDAAGRLLPKCAPLTLRHPGRYELCVNVPGPEGEEICDRTVHFQAAEDALPGGSICAAPAHTQAGSASAGSPALLRPRSPVSSWLHGIGGAAGALPSTNTAEASKHCKYRHRPSPKEFDNCAQFATYFKGRLALSNVAWAYEYVPKVRRNGKLHVTVTWKLSDTSYVDDPVWSWPLMTEREERAVAEARAKLSVHEHGHLQVAARFVREHETQTFVADNRKQALTILEETVKRWERRMKAERDRYDAVTDFGRTQSKGPSAGYPDGEDVVFSCP